MPIKGLSEQRRLPRIGKLRLGIKKPNSSGNGEHPSAVDYFVLPESIIKLFPEEPREIAIMFPTEDDEVICQQYYKRYSSTRGLTCRGDGETCRRMIDKDTGSFADRNTKEVVWKEHLDCQGRLCTEYSSKPQNCKEVMNLQFIMPDIPGLGIWQIDTSSINSIRNINNAIAMTRAVYKRIAYIPLLLTIEPTEVINPDDGKKKKVYVLNLRTRGTMRELMVSANQPVTELLLPCPSDDEAPIDMKEEHVEEIVSKVESPAAPKAEIIPPEKPKKEAGKKLTKKQVDEAPPLTDEDFDDTSSQRPEDLKQMVFKNPGEFYTACLKKLGLDKSSTEKEIPEYDLSKPDQRQKAWEHLLSIFKQPS